MFATVRGASPAFRHHNNIETTFGIVYARTLRVLIGIAMGGVGSKL
jgi:hypothetical protein